MVVMAVGMNAIGDIGELEATGEKPVDVVTMVWP